MVDQLIQILVFVLVFALFAWALYWVCTHFFPGFTPALWICGVVLLILLLLAVTGQVPMLHVGAFRK